MSIVLGQQTNVTDSMGDISVAVTTNTKLNEVLDNTSHNTSLSIGVNNMPTVRE